MKKIIPIVVCVLTVFGIKAQPFNPLLAAMLQDTLDHYVAQIPSIKGMSASVYIPGQGAWNGASGNSHAGQAITSDMRFGIASNAKLFTAVMLLKLAENNIISLEDELNDWLTISNANIDTDITIRQLLNHTSGISDPFFGPPWFDTINANPTRVFTPNEVLGWVSAPLFPAGTNWGYSNTNYVLAGMVAQSATGYSLGTLIRDSILNPLNLNNTFLDVEESVNGTLAHRWWNAIDYHNISRVGLNSAVGYAGSIFSTASDMVQWYNALFTGQVINQSSMNELTTFVTTNNPNYQYGLGLSRDITQGFKYWGHGGSTWGYKSKMMYDTCLHVAVSGLANSFPAGMDAVTFLLYRAVKNHIPGCSGAIDGPVTVLEGTNSVTYTVPTIPNASSYVWNLPSGVTGTSNSNTITVTFESGSISGYIQVTGVNNYGPGGSSSLWVTVEPLSLPVDFISLTVKRIENSVEIQWQTAFEENVEKFVIERSENGLDFYSIHEMKPKNSIHGSTYTFLDNHFFDALAYYYRIKIVDLDGQYDYSTISILSFEKQAQRIKIYPTILLQNELHIEGLDGQKYALQIIHSNGAKVFEGEINSPIIQFPNQLFKGFYFISIYNEQGVLVKKSKLIID